MFGVRGYPTIWFVTPEVTTGKVNFNKLGSQGYVAGGPGAQNVINKYSFTSAGNATDSGDLIGVFYTSGSGVQCGGNTIFDGTFPFTIAAWGEEPGQDNGFTSGEEFFLHKI